MKSTNPFDLGTYDDDAGRVAIRAVHREPEMLAIYDRIIAECSKRGLYVGIHCGSAEYAVRAIKMGFNMVTITNDASLMAMAARNAIKTVRDGIA